MVAYCDLLECIAVAQCWLKGHDHYDVSTEPFSSCTLVLSPTLFGRYIRKQWHFVWVLSWLDHLLYPRSIRGQRVISNHWPRLNSYPTVLMLNLLCNVNLPVSLLIWTEATMKWSRVSFLVRASYLDSRFCTKVGENRYPICWKAKIGRITRKNKNV